MTTSQTFDSLNRLTQIESVDPQLTPQAAFNDTYNAATQRPEQALREYRWSSWPEYLKGPSRRWPWRRVDRLLGDYHVPQDSTAGRRRLEQALEERRTAERGGRPPGAAARVVPGSPGVSEQVVGGK